MFKKGWVYIAIGVLTLGAIFLMEYNKPKNQLVPILCFPS